MKNADLNIQALVEHYQVVQFYVSNYTLSRNQTYIPFFLKILTAPKLSDRASSDHKDCRDLQA